MVFNLCNEKESRPCLILLTQKDDQFFLLINIHASWEFKLFEPQQIESIDPSEGDILKISTSRPFSAEDTYVFSTTSSKIEDADVENDMDRINVVTNPYVVTNQLEQLDLQNPLDRGPRRIYFNHLPKNCTVCYLA